jgi:lipoprotein-releasing system permease protein
VKEPLRFPRRLGEPTPLYRITLSLKYLLSRRLNLICVVGVALGVMLLILVLSVMDGFQDQLKETLRGSLSDLILTPRYRMDFDRFEAALREREPEIVALSPQLQDFAIVAPDDETERREDKAGAFVIGVDPAREMAVSAFRDYLRDRRTGEFTVADPDEPFRPADEDLREKFPGIVLGRDLADDLHIGPGDVVYLLTAHSEPNPETSRNELKPVEKRFAVTGYYESGNSDYDRHVVYVDRQAARDFTGDRRDLAEVRVKLRDFPMADAVKADLLASEYEIYRASAVDRQRVLDLEAVLDAHRAQARAEGQEFRVSDIYPPGYFMAVETWKDRRRIFLAAIEHERGIMNVIVSLILVVSAFMILALLSMQVVHKTRDIGIIKALGGTTRGVLSIFMWNGLVMGIVGSFGGLGLGLLVTRFVNQIERFVSGIISWITGQEVGLFPKSIYLFSEIPARVEPFMVVKIMGFAILVSWLAALYPARRASRMDPVEALRYE